MADSEFHDSLLCAGTAVHVAVIDPVERWRLAGMQVRLCVYADEPRLIERYLAMGRWLHARSQIPLWDIAIGSAQLLLDTAADRALPMHWRCLCLDNVYRPLNDLAQSADGDHRQRQLAVLHWKLATLDISIETSAYPGFE